MALTDVATIKTQLGITDSSEDALLAQLLAQVESVIANETHRVFESATYTEYLHGNGTRKLVLGHTPVTSITAIYEDVEGWYGVPTDSFDSATLLVPGEDYVLDVNDGTQSTTGIVWRINANWQNTTLVAHKAVAPQLDDQPGSIKVTYVAGYTTIPKDLELAAINMVAALRKSAKLGKPIAGFSLDYFSVQFGTDSALDSAVKIVRRYREPVI